MNTQQENQYVKKTYDKQNISDEALNLYFARHNLIKTNPLNSPALTGISCIPNANTNVYKDEHTNIL